MGEFRILLHDGREFPVSGCCCEVCNNKWFVIASSEEWIPNFCCYCGIKLVYKRYEDES